MKNKDNILIRLSEFTKLTYDENNNLLFGYMDKYCVSIQQFHNICFIIIPLKLNESYTLSDINKFFSKLENNVFVASQYITSISYNNYYISVKFNLARNIVTSCNNICNLLDNIINEVKKYKLQPCCPQCGDTADIRPYLVNKGILFRCGLCIYKLEEGLQKREKNNKSNTLNNIIGALIGSLIGLAALTVLSLITKLNGFFAFILAFLIIKGYENSGGKLNRKSTLFACILGGCMIFISSYISIGISLFLNNSYSSFIECMNNIPYEMALNNYQIDFIRNVMISISSLFIGMFIILKVDNSKTKKVKSVQELYY